jgi:hypothetical protein
VTAFWPAIGWMVLAYSTVSVLDAIWLLLVGTGASGGGTRTSMPSVAAAPPRR